MYNKAFDENVTDHPNILETDQNITIKDQKELKPSPSKRSDLKREKNIQ